MVMKTCLISNKQMSDESTRMIQSQMTINIHAIDINVILMGLDPLSIIDAS
jgi:hypothetical protein